MKRLQPFLLFALFLSLTMFAQAQQADLPQQCAAYLPDGNTAFPSFVRFQPAHMPSANELHATLHQCYGLGADDVFVLQRTSTDKLGFTHQTWQLQHQGYPVFASVVKTHVRGGKLESFNGRVAHSLPTAQVTLTEAQALDRAMQSVGASVYKWQLPGEEAYLKRTKGNASATYFPQGTLTYVKNQGQISSQPHRLAWRFDIYAHEPSSRADVYVDAVTGEVIYRNETMHTIDVPGTAHTRYSGVRTIITDSTASGYRLREATHGGGIETYDMNSGTNYANAVDFTDSDNVWINPQPPLDQAALDVHWGITLTYEYFLQQHNRDSYNYTGGKLRNYVHFNQNWFNAQWTGDVMNFGDGNGNPLTTLDICAHELTHGMTEYSAGLIYQYESGALNESFSDIFGNTVEAYMRPGQQSWHIAEDMGAFRSMSNPNLFQAPDTYLGTWWATGAADNGGVHTNSGVQNFWYYLLVNGGSGTNDNGDAYSVTALGLDSAAAIAYRNLDVYMTPESQYIDARFGSIQAAIDLFGECSPQMIQTFNAWHAVGVGQPYTGNLQSAFYTPDTNLCAPPYLVQFTNQSVSAVHYLWRFGDGTTSTLPNPSHLYTFLGDYDVTLIAYGCNGTSDTTFYADRVHLELSQNCPVSMPLNDIGYSEECTGNLHDSGGGNNYPNNSNSTFTILPGGNSQVLLTFSAFDFAAGDRLTVFDGPDVQSPQIAILAGSTLPAPIVSTSGSLTLRESTNGSNTRAGFQASWSCFVGTVAEAQVKWEVYPNPAQDQVRFLWPRNLPEDYVVSLYDGLGRLQLQQSGHHDGTCTGSLDLSQLARGVYMLSVTAGDARVNQKLILKNFE